MSQVFLARHSLLGREVALKVLRPELVNHHEAIRRFFLEARSVNQIENDHIVQIFDFVQETRGASPGYVYCVMEVLRGCTLAEWFCRGALSLEDALSVTLQVCYALAAAHRVGVVHR